MSGEVDGRVRLALVDDHLLVRQGLKALLEIEGDAEVVGQAGTQQEAIALFGSVACDFILMDLHLPDSDGFSCLQAARRLKPDTPVLMLTMETDGRIVEGALRAGARGFLPKTAGVDEIRQAMDAVARGGVYLHPQVARFLNQSRSAADAVQAEALTQRERDVLGCVTRGLKNAQIAQELFLGESTVKTHLRSLLRKTGASTRSELVYLSLTHGLLDG